MCVWLFWVKCSVFVCCAVPCPAGGRPCTDTASFRAAKVSTVVGVLLLVLVFFCSRETGTVLLYCTFDAIFGSPPPHASPSSNSLITNVWCGMVARQVGKKRVERSLKVETERHAFALPKSSTLCPGRTNMETKQQQKKGQR